MLKCVDAKVVFAEVPDEITLAISISGCPCKCKGCHSAYLTEDIGKELTWYSCTGKLKKSVGLSDLIIKNKGITCVCFMGGDNDPRLVNELASRIRKHCAIASEHWGNLKIAWYSGRQELSKDINLINFDFVKLGPYNEEYGPLNKKTTNQRFYKVIHLDKGKCELIDRTYKFWKHET